jgi:hypothetical protein
MFFKVPVGFKKLYNNASAGYRNIPCGSVVDTPCNFFFIFTKIKIMQIFRIENKELVETYNILDETVVWIDVTREEDKEFVKKTFDVEGSRQFKLRSSLITEKELARNYEIDFYLLPKLLITIHAGVIHLKLGKQKPQRSIDIMLSLLSEEILRIDTQLQIVEENVEDLSEVIFNIKEKVLELREAIVSIGNNSSLVLRLNRCLKNIIDELKLLESEIEVNFEICNTEI